MAKAVFIYRGRCRIHGYQMELRSDHDLGDKLTFNCPTNGRHKRLRRQVGSQ